jgi:hypothetical protein
MENSADMKKTLALLGAFLMVVSGSPVTAQMPVMTPGALPVSSSVPAGFEKVGVVGAASGQVELKAPGQAGRIASSGQPVFMGDEIKTDEKGRLQILFLDQTVFTIGPKSTLVIDEFVYDPKTNDGKIKASITKGVFRYVSGKIAAKNKDSVSVKLPTATIGFRGTIVGGNVGEDGGALAGLLGPGANNDAGEDNGSFVMRNGSGDQQEVNRAGFGVRAGADGDISGVFQLSNDEINGLTAGLSPSGDQSGEGGGSATDESGEGIVLTGENSSSANSLENLSDSNSDTTTLAAQDAAEDSAGIADGITKMSDLSKIVTGIFHYYITGTYYGSGTMSGKIEIDFGSRTIAGGNSYITISDGVASDTTSGMSTPQPFGSSGNAVFHWSNVSGSQGTFTNIDIALGNSGGVVAENATVKVDYSPISANPAPGSGSGEGSRSPGPA